MVSGDVKETCLNWFYKIASIRELLPRLYLEIALIKSMSFLTQTEFDQTLLRLCHMIRGIGDPLIAAYARCYLCRVGPTVTKNTKYLEENLDDFLFVYHTVIKTKSKKLLCMDKMELIGWDAIYCVFFRFYSVAFGQI